MAKVAKWGKEFLVNTTTKGWQTSASVVGLSDGGFLVAWEDTSGKGADPSGSAIRAQLFDADGSKAGGEFLVNTTTASLQSQPAAARLADGRFAIAWGDLSKTGGDTSGEAVRGQVFDADGSKSGAEFLANTATLNFQFVSGTMGSLTNGRFVAAWSDNSASGGDTSSWAIRAQIFNPDGGKFGGEILVNTSTTGSQIGPAASGLADGRFLVTWQDEPGGADTDGNIKAQIFSASGGKVGGEIAVNTTTGGEQSDPSTAVLAGGRFVIAWTDFGDTGETDGDVRGQIFNADGTRSGAEFLINTTTAGSQESQVIAPLPDGRFVVAWFDDSKSGGDGAKGAIRAQVFEADGSKSGGEFLVNTTTKDNQALPTIAPLLDGRFVVAWSDFSQDGADKSEAAIRAQIFDPREGPATIEGSASGESLVGTRFKDAIDGSGGDDTLDGGRGADSLTGGAGRDGFAFTDVRKKTKADTITDFSTSEDTILLDNALFEGIGRAGGLKDKFFHVGRKAGDGNDRIVYNDQNGKLLYDANGDDKGGTVKFAVVSPGLGLTADDILVI